MKSKNRKFMIGYGVTVCGLAAICFIAGYVLGINMTGFVVLYAAGAIGAVALTLTRCRADHIKRRFDSIVHEGERKIQYEAERRAAKAASEADCYEAGENPACETLDKALFIEDIKQDFIFKGFQGSYNDVIVDLNNIDLNSFVYKVNYPESKLILFDKEGA